MKKFLMAVVCIFFAFSILDYVLHFLILSSTYQQTPQLWRPMPEMKALFMHLSTLVHAVIFVIIFKMLAAKGVMNGIKFGFILGLGMGFGMGFGSYSYMPISLYLATVWFIGTVVEMMVAGWIAGSIVKE